MGFSAADLDKIIQQQKNVRGIDEAKNKEGAQPPVWNRNGAFYGKNQWKMKLAL